MNACSEGLCLRLTSLLKRAGPDIHRNISQQFELWEAVISARSRLFDVWLLLSCYYG